MAPQGSRPAPPQAPVELPKGIIHGGYRAYQYYRCRCLKCQTFMRASKRDRYWANPPPRLREPADHGSLHFYNKKGCRCEPCKDVRRAYDDSRPVRSHKRGHAPARAPMPRKRLKDRKGPWYTCVEDGRRYDWHDYLAGQCLRCDAKQDTEELWEQKWRET